MDQQQPIVTDASGVIPHSHNGVDSPLLDAVANNIPTNLSFLTALVTDADGPSITFNIATSNKHIVTLGGNRTLNISNVPVGFAFIIGLTQDGTGSRTVTWFPGITWDYGNSTPVLTTTASKTDWFGFICVSAGNYHGFIMGQNI